LEILDYYIHSNERRSILLHLIESKNIETLLQDYHKLPEKFKINLVDKSTINANNNSEFHSFLRSNCWILIDDGAENLVPQIYKTAIHLVEWDQLIKYLEKELLIVINKCISVNNLFQSQVEKEFIKIQKLDNSIEIVIIDRIYLFTIIDKKTYIYYTSGEGTLKRLIIQNSLSSLETALQGYKFFRTHKKFLINVNQLNDNIDLNSDQIKIGDNLIAKLSRRKHDDFINFLENL